MLDRPTFRRTLAVSAHNDLEETAGVLRTVPLLEPLTEAQLVAMAEAVKPVHFSAGELVIEKGTAGSIFYILRSGAVLCTDIGVEGGKKFDDLALGPGDYFGERALLRGEPRAANVRATSEVTCLVLDRQGFTELLGPLKDVINANLSRRVLLSVPMLKALSDEERSAVAEACEVCEAAPGAAVIAEGETGDAFYIVKEGTMLVTQKGGAEAAREVATLGSGDFFGEMALLKDDVRQATVTASGEGGAVLFKLTRKKFVELLGPLSDILSREAGQRAAQIDSVGQPTSVAEAEVPAAKNFGELRQRRASGPPAGRRRTPTPPSRCYAILCYAMLTPFLLALSPPRPPPPRA